MNIDENKINDLSDNINLNNGKKLGNVNIKKISEENKQELNDNAIQKEENEKNIGIKDNAVKNNDSKESKKIRKNEIIDQFLEEMEKNKEESKENIKQNNKEDVLSDDPFLKAEKEYRIKNIIKEDKNIKIKKKIKKEDLHNIRYKTENMAISSRSNKSKKNKELGQNIIFNHFKKGNSIKNKSKTEYNFKPIIFNNPEKLYFKAIIEEKINYLKMRSYDRRTGIFDIKKFNKSKNTFLNNNKENYNYFNSTKTSFYSTHQEMKALNYNNYNYNNYFKYLNNNDNKNIKNNNRLNKRNLNINNDKYLLTINNKKRENFSNEDNFFYTSVKTNNNAKTETNNKKNNFSSKTENSQKETKKTNSANNCNKINKNRNKKITNSANNKISIEKMRDYLLEFHKNQIKSKSRLLSNTKLRYKNKKKNLINNFLNSIDDPKNPYSITFTRSLLKNQYNLDIDYKNFARGVPMLTLKPSMTWFKCGLNENINPKVRMAKTSYNNFPSGFNFSSNSNKNNKRYQSMTQTGNNFYRK